MSVCTALLDACVLYSAPVRDLLVRLANKGNFAAKWTDEIHEEWIRNLLRNRPDIAPEKLARTRRLMDLAIQDSLVSGYQDLIPTLTLPDAGDRHVLAAAINARANVIVTFNEKHFPTSLLAEHNLEPVDPDKFLIRQIGLSETSVVEVAREARGDLRRPPVTVDEFLKNLHDSRLIRTAERLRRYIDRL